MKLMPFGDYYLWFCDWCDSQNRTIWTRIDTHNLTCAACYRPVDLAGTATMQPPLSLVKHAAGKLHQQ